MEELYVEANGVRFHVIADGPEDGPLVLLLHGFPELCRSWRHQLPALAAKGFRAVAPDLRGYGQTERKGPYDITNLARDVSALVRALGRERATVVGHDWGGAVAYGAAMYEASVVERLVILNAGGGPAIGEKIPAEPHQVGRIAMCLLILIPGLMEWLLSLNNAEAVVRILRSRARNANAWPDEEVAEYRKAFLEPAAGAAALAYYRTSFRESARIRETPRNLIACPTLIIWGTADTDLELPAPEKLAALFSPGNAPAVHRIEGAGHFVQNDAPAEVNEALLRWLG
jgi:epoxide hydrolase 4